MERHPVRPSLALATLALLAAATACGGTPDPAGPTTGPTPVPTSGASSPTSTPEQSGDTSGGCVLVSLDDASAALGTPLREVAAAPAGCVFAGLDDADLGVTVTATQIAIDPAEYAAQTRDLCEDEPADADGVEEGTVAFVCSLYDRSQGFWFRGADAVTVQVEGLPAPALAEATLALVGAVSGP